MEDFAAPSEARRVPNWFAQTPAMALAFDGGGKVVFANARWLAAFGYSREEAAGLARADLLPAHASDSSNKFDGEFTMLRRDGDARRVALASATAEEFVFVIVNDVTELKLAEQRLQREIDSGTLYRQLVEASNDVIIRIDRDLVRTYVSPASREVFGYEPEALIGKKTGEAAHPDDAQRHRRALAALVEGRLMRHVVVNRRRHCDGRWIWVEATYRALTDPVTGQTNEIVLTVRDISARKAIEEQLADAYRRLEVLAGQDGLTGLANRRTFDARLAKEFRLALRRQGALTLAMIDVDHFKAFNDAYGHPAGDECLKQVGAAIHETVDRSAWLAARIGGEEFAVIAPSVDENAAIRLGERVCEAIRWLKIPHAGSPLSYVTASVGLASLTRARIELGASQVLADADQALYAAKAQGRNCIQHFSRLCRGNAAALAS
jgi:diguanylate cyclase (GGDEF)-like protein/PAS domain S-box-containing protein